MPNTVRGGSGHLHSQNPSAQYPAAPDAMKISLPAIAILGALIALPPALPVAAASGEWWLAPNGSDANTGSSNAPLATLGAALDKSRNWSRAQKSAPGDALRIVLREGIYPLARPVLM